MELPKNLKLIIFDFDGTLHNLDMNWPAVRQAVGIDQSNEKLGDAIDRFKLENNQMALQTITDMEMRAVEGLAFKPKTIDALRKLSSHYQLAILSRNSRLAIEHMVQNSGLSGISVVGREDVNRLKPDPEGVDIILSYFNISSEHAVLIGDTSHDVVVAKNAGLACIIIGNNYQEVDNHKPTLRVNSISDLEYFFADSFNRR